MVDVYDEIFGAPAENNDLKCVVTLVFGGVRTTFILHRAAFAGNRKTTVIEWEFTRACSCAGSTVDIAGRLATNLHYIYVAFGVRPSYKNRKVPAPTGRNQQFKLIGLENFGQISRMYKTDAGLEFE